jgi:hypothetical protein
MQNKCIPGSQLSLDTSSIERVSGWGMSEQEKLLIRQRPNAEGAAPRHCMSQHANRMHTLSKTQCTSLIAGMLSSRTWCWWCPSRNHFCSALPSTAGWDLVLPLGLLSPAAAKQVLHPGQRAAH